MNEQAIINKIASLPYDKFSSTIFLEQLNQILSEFTKFGDELIRDFIVIDSKFKRKQIEKIIRNSQNSTELNNNLKPYLNEFITFSNQFFSRLENFFNTIEEKEAIISGFKYRFLADSIITFQKTLKCQVYLLDPNDEDLKKLGEKIHKFTKELNEDIVKERQLFLMATEENVKEYISKLNFKKRGIFSFLRFFRKIKSFNERYSDLLNDIKKNISGQKERETYKQFDELRSLIIQDLNSNKLKLDFIKRLNDYFTYLLRIETLVFKIEKDLALLLCELNRNLEKLNQKIFEFINYILNEEKVSAPLKEQVKSYLYKKDQVEKGILSFTSIENNLNESIKSLNNELINDFEKLMRLIKENQAKNQTNSEELLRKRL